jgi:hypothetical protein
LLQRLADLLNPLASFFVALGGCAAETVKLLVGGGPHFIACLLQAFHRLRRAVAKLPFHFLNFFRGDVRHGTRWI